MRLTDHTDYSLRVLMYLNQEKKLITLNDLAEKLDISKNNLIKVSHELAKIGLIETTKGRSGGLLIKNSTSKKSIAEIIMQTEESFNLAECFTENQCECTFLKNCLLKNVLKTALKAFTDSLAQATLDDVTPRRSKTI